MERASVIDLYDRLIARHAGLGRKGKATAYTAMNGNMFSFVGPDGQLCIRLSKADKAAFDGQFGAEPVVRYNSVMDGYVAVTDALLSDEELLSEWFAKSVDFAQSLKPKPTKKKN